MDCVASFLATQINSQRKNRNLKPKLSNFFKTQNYLFKLNYFYLFTHQEELQEPHTDQQQQEGQRLAREFINKKPERKAPG